MLTTREHQMGIAQVASAETTGALQLKLLRLLADKADKKNWVKEIIKFLLWLANGMQGDTPYNIFVYGNSKINSQRFALFSALPIVTCPGLGECAKWCYSLKCWRYPAAFLRQLQNTLLLLTRDGRVRIREAFCALPADIKLRLYVDGDFDSKETLVWWMMVLKLRPDVRAYGYSKSWEEFIQADEFFKSTGSKWPNNYKLNLSSGGKDEFNEEIRNKIINLPVVRGEFIVLPSSFRGEGRYDNPLYKKELRESFKVSDGRKSFICPGKCSTCAGGSHACGSDKFDDIPILIGSH